MRRGTMDVILIGLAISIVGVMMTVLLFAAVARPPEDGFPNTERTDASPTTEPFWAREEEVAGSSETPAENTRVTIEDHFKSEIRAARVFLEGPTRETLHAPSDPPQAS
jgi:hypothetical protein